PVFRRSKAMAAKTANASAGRMCASVSARCSAKAPSSATSCGGSVEFGYAKEYNLRSTTATEISTETHTAAVRSRGRRSIANDLAGTPPVWQFVLRLVKLFMAGYKGLWILLSVNDLTICASVRKAPTVTAKP